jgi:hypothetical protein
MMGFPTGCLAAYAYQEASSLVPAQVLHQDRPAGAGASAAPWVGRLVRAARARRLALAADL